MQIQKFSILMSINFTFICIAIEIIIDTRNEKKSHLLIYLLKVVPRKLLPSMRMEFPGNIITDY